MFTRLGNVSNHLTQRNNSQYRQVATYGVVRLCKKYFLKLSKYKISLVSYTIQIGTVFRHPIHLQRLQPDSLKNTVKFIT